jgi:hypothetical protein
MTIRINEERDALVRVGDEVGRVTEARVEVLLEEHRSNPRPSAGP